MTWRLFALERYGYPDAERSSEPLSLTTPDARLVGAFYLPADEVVLVLVEALDAGAVMAATRQAGWRVDRQQPAEWVSARPTRRAHEGDA